jgi:hypothetical protein
VPRAYHANFEEFNSFSPRFSKNGQELAFIFVRGRCCCTRFELSGYQCKVEMSASTIFSKGDLGMDWFGFDRGLGFWFSIGKAWRP